MQSNVHADNINYKFYYCKYLYSFIQSIAKIMSYNARQVSTITLYCVNSTNPTGSLSRAYQRDYHLCQWGRNETICNKPAEDEIGSWSVLIWLVLSEILYGLATSIISVLGLAYIDANSPTEKLAFYIG